MHEIPERFWSLFRSVNRATYIEALLKINEEYEYSNYFLSREMCIQLLSSYFAQKRYVIWQDELEEEEDQLEPPATRVLNWLLKTGWLRKVDDYSTMTVNIVIPDYAAVMIEAFHRLSNEQEDETQIYIQNVYAILFSLKNDSRAGIGLLDTAIINTRKLNKSLQDLLHNMDTFFGSLLEQKDYSQLLKDHLEGYVQEVVNKKGWLKESEFVEMMAIAQSAPGPIALNTAIFVGYKARGVKGVIFSSLGTILPSFIVILLIAIIFTDFKNNPGVERVFKGIRPAVVALIAAPLYKMGKSAGITRKTVIFPVIAAILVWQLNLSPIYIIIAAILGGLLYGKITHKL